MRKTALSESDGYERPTGMSVPTSDRVSGDRGTELPQHDVMGAANLDSTGDKEAPPGAAKEMSTMGEQLPAGGRCIDSIRDEVIAYQLDPTGKFKAKEVVYFGTLCTKPREVDDRTLVRIGSLFNGVPLTAKGTLLEVVGPNAVKPPETAVQQLPPYHPAHSLVGSSPELEVEVDWFHEHQLIDLRSYFPDDVTLKTLKPTPENLRMIMRSIDANYTYDQLCDRVANEMEAAYTSQALGSGKEPQRWSRAAWRQEAREAVHNDCVGVVFSIRHTSSRRLDNPTRRHEYLHMAS